MSEDKIYAMKAKFVGEKDYIEHYDVISYEQQDKLLIVDFKDKTKLYMSISNMLFISFKELSKDDLKNEL